MLFEYNHFIQISHKGQNMKKRVLAFLMALGVAVSMTTAISAAEAPAKKKKQTPQGLYVNPQEAYDMKMKDPDHVLVIDVRTPEELYFVGYASIVDKNIPLAYVEYGKLNKKGKKFASHKNKNIVTQIDAFVKSKGLDKETAKIITFCRSGDRSAAVATMLGKAGYKHAYTQIEGTEGDKSKDKKLRTVNGWKNAGLPYTYKFNKDLYVDLDGK